MENLAGKTVVVGLSGGVDSSVAAVLLKQQGARVIGLFMKNWEESDASGVCLASKEFADVTKVCRQLAIPCYSVEFVEQYRRRVFDSFLNDLKRGFTPNPDILCNQEIKFKLFFNKAMEFGADYLATGHYCRKELLKGRTCLLKGSDSNKDQSYFLHTLKEDVLAKVLFPVGALPKPHVRQMAQKHRLATGHKKDSTGICFIGKRNFKTFLSRYIPFRPGPFKLLDGTVVGQHQGTPFYTLGQRKGLGLGEQGEPWFVVAKDVPGNTVFVERGDHPALYSKELTTGPPEWVNAALAAQMVPGASLRLAAKVRYRQSEQPCQVTVLPDGHLRAVFDSPQRALTPGQSAVFYRQDVCLGGGVILQ